MRLLYKDGEKMLINRIKITLLSFFSDFFCYSFGVNQQNSLSLYQVYMGKSVFIDALLSLGLLK